MVAQHQQDRAGCTRPCLTHSRPHHCLLLAGQAQLRLHALLQCRGPDPLPALQVPAVCLPAAAGTRGGQERVSEGHPAPVPPQLTPRQGSPSPAAPQHRGFSPPGLPLPALPLQQPCAGVPLRQNLKPKKRVWWGQGFNLHEGDVAPHCPRLLPGEPGQPPPHPLPCPTSARCSKGVWLLAWAMAGAAGTPQLPSAPATPLTASRLPWQRHRQGCTPGSAALDPAGKDSPQLEADGTRPARGNCHFIKQ